ncbi:MAG TPA: hypothetical protein VJL38_03780 [Patescibacteria group bacterium]|nr:hypothetical protein [Patescibacteria group bacterium]
MLLHIPMKLRRDIIATITYYDVLDYPLTGFEIWKYLLRAHNGAGGEYTSATLGEVLLALSSDQVLLRYIDTKDGFHVLRGRTHLLEERRARNRGAIHKVRGVRRLAALLRFVPFVRGVFVTGRLAMKNTQSRSDWDLLIVLKHGRIWTGRFLVTTLLHIIGKRRHGKKVKDRACLNYFITTESLEIEPKDLYAAHEYSFVLPLYGAKIFERFQFANHWIARYKPNYNIAEIMPILLCADTAPVRFFQRTFEFLCDARLVEWCTRIVQERKIAKNPMTRAPGGMVSTSDDALIFLPHPHGPDIFEKYKDKMSRISIPSKDGA